MTQRRRASTFDTVILGESDESDGSKCYLWIPPTPLCSPGRMPYCTLEAGSQTTYSSGATHDVVLADTAIQDSEGKGQHHGARRYA